MAHGLAELIRSALQGIAARPVRTLLILSGPAIGVAAIVAAIGLTESAKGDIKARLDELGTNLVTVEASATFATAHNRPSLPEEATERLESVPIITSASAVVELPGIRVLPYEKAAEAFEILPLAVRSAEADLPEVAGGELAWGRWLDGWDEVEGHRTVVLGAEVAEAFAVLPGERRTILLDDRPYGVAGVLAELDLLPRYNQSVFISRQAAADDWGHDGGPTEVLFRVADGHHIGSADTDFLDRVITYGGPGGIEPPVVPTDTLEAAADIDSTLRTIVLLMGTLALLVGGIGIANVMSISVLQRSSEIGIRRAIGHTRTRVALQFLVEAGAVGFLGGLVGAGLGALAVVLGVRWRDWVLVLDPSMLASAVGLAVVVAVLSGLIPAMRAARMEPLSALRLT